MKIPPSNQDPSFAGPLLPWSHLPHQSFSSLGFTPSSGVLAKAHYFAWNMLNNFYSEGWNGA